MVLPTFLVIGAAKSGTTSLSAYLGAHPEVFMASPKEPHFFYHNWDRGLFWYESLFELGRDHMARGEASTSYSQAPHVPGVPRRIASTIPDAKLIYIIRNPVDRIRSQYGHHVDKWRQSGSIEAAIRQRPSYLNTSRYAFQIENFLRFFERDQLLVISSEDLLAHRKSVLDEVFDFIGVSRGVTIETVDIELNRTVDKRRPLGGADFARSVLRRFGMSDVLSPASKHRLKRIWSRTIEESRLEMPRDIEEEIWKELQTDLESLRVILGPEFNLWGRA